MQQQFDSLMAAVKGAQKEQEKPPDRDLTRDWEIATKAPITMTRGPTGKMVAKLAIQPEAIKIRLEGEMIKAKFNAITARDGGTCIMSAAVPKMHGL